MRQPFLRTQVQYPGAYKAPKLRLNRLAHGIPSTLPAEPVTKHVNWLRDLGFSCDAIAADAGLPQRTVWLISEGRHQVVLLETAQRLMRVSHVPTQNQLMHKVPALGAKRRIRAMQRIGHSLRDLGDEIEMTNQQLCQIATRRHVIRGATWFRIHDLYEKRCARPGNNRKAIGIALRDNYDGPLAWEGTDIDHPDSVPLLDVEHASDVIDEVLLQRIIEGRHTYPDANPLRGPERAAVIDHAITHGWLRARLAAALNISTDGADQALLRRRRELRKEAA